MSDNVLRIIPGNHDYLPDEKNFEQVLTRIAEFVYGFVSERNLDIGEWTGKRNG